MNLQAYQNILTQKGENPEEIANGETFGMTRGEVAFKKDLLRKKVVWENNFTDDWHSFMKNYHPLYSICTAPKQHPYSRKERCVVFICNIALSCILAIFVAAVVDEIKNPDPDTTTDTDTSDSNITAFAANVMLSIPFGIFKALINGCLKLIAICPCLQTNHRSTFCRSCCECIGHCIICIWLFILILMFILMIVLAIQYGIFAGFCLSFFISNLTGWIFSFLCLSCIFRLKWKKEHNDPKAIKNFKITYIDYQMFSQQSTNDVQDGDQTNYMLMMNEPTLAVNELHDSSNK